MENWLTALIIAVILMAVALSLLPHLERRALGRKPGRAVKPGPDPAAGGPENYGLAPKNPDVMAGAMFELLSLKLNFKEITAFADLVISEEMTARYLDRLAARSSLAKFARNLAYLCNSMKFNGFTPEDRARVAEALRVKARKEYKLLEIQKNLDNIF
ncbi:MAG: hypothetical protein JXQ83_10220 [Candidatus Glassbacteria bacterium]|nr:hypothetical protein [Candidatus Glassbacteria bacterium]